MFCWTHLNLPKLHRKEKRIPPNHLAWQGWGALSLEAFLHARLFGHFFPGLFVLRVCLRPFPLREGYHATGTINLALAKLFGQCQGQGCCQDEGFKGSVKRRAENFFLFLSPKWIQNATFCTLWVKKNAQKIRNRGPEGKIYPFGSWVTPQG